MSYKILSASLWPTAEHSKNFFKKRFGISSFKKEEAIDADMAYLPTLSAVNSEHYRICIEVSENAWPENNQLDAFVLDCKNKRVPVKLYVVMPKGASDSGFKAKLQRAKKNGVGVIEVDENDGYIYCDALPLSLTGLISSIPTSFPAKYRAAICQAEETFCNGAPDKGCAKIYDEIEALSRKLARKTKDKGFWQAPPPGQKSPRIYIATGSWAKVIEEGLMEHLIITKCNCPKLTTALLARILGVTTHRNETGHKPRTTAQLKARDEQLRTRFESARDLLHELIHATKPLHL